NHRSMGYSDGLVYGTLLAAIPPHAAGQTYCAVDEPPYVSLSIEWISGCCSSSTPCTPERQKLISARGRRQSVGRVRAPMRDGSLPIRSECWDTFMRVLNCGAIAFVRLRYCVTERFQLNYGGCIHSCLGHQEPLETDESPYTRAGLCPELRACNGLMSIGGL